MARGGLSLKYFTPAIKPRIKPTFKPHLTAAGVAGVHVKPRILPSGGGLGSLSVPHATFSAVRPASVSTLLKQTHTGKQPKFSSIKTAAQPKSASSQTGITSRPAGSLIPMRTSLPTSVRAMHPGTGPKLTSPLSKAQRSVTKMTRPYKAPAVRSMLRG